MLKDLTKNAYGLYKNNINQYNKFFLDNMVLPNGIYILLDISKNQKQFIIKETYEKKAKDIDEVMEDKFKYYNKCSFMTDANKVIDTIVKDLSGKRIYSTNIFSLIMKREKILEIDIKYITNRYIDLLYNQAKFKDMIKIFKTEEEFKENSQLYELNEYIGSIERKKIFDEIKEFYTNNFIELQDFVRNNYDDKYNNTYFKFFVLGYDEYIEKEYLLYLYSYGFLNNDYNYLNDDKQLVGVANIDTSYNSKKPFNISVTKYQKNIGSVIPYYLLPIYNDVYNYIMVKSRKKENFMNVDFKFDTDANYDVGETFYQVMGYNGIEDFDITSSKKDTIDFIFRNYLNKLPNNKDLIDYNDIKYRLQLRKMFFSVYFESAVKEYDVIKQITEIKSASISDYNKNIFYANKNVFHNYFYFGYDGELKLSIDKITSGLLLGLVKNNDGLDEYKIIKAINFRISLLDYFKVRKGKEMENKFNEIRTNLTNYINSNINGLEFYQINDIEEFVYLAGQLARYFVDRSEANEKEKTFRMLEGVYGAKTIEVLKTRVKILFEKYNHAIRINNNRFGMLYKSLITYQNNKQSIKEYNDYLYAGTVGDNIFYLKKEGMKNE